MYEIPTSEQIARELQILPNLKVIIVQNIFHYLHKEYCHMIKFYY
jgi:hypothetical protein